MDGGFLFDASSSVHSVEGSICLDARASWFVAAFRASNRFEMPCFAFSDS